MPSNAYDVLPSTCICCHAAPPYPGAAYCPTCLVGLSCPVCGATVPREATELSRMPSA
jgi:hypothetical protein